MKWTQKYIHEAQFSVLFPDEGRATLDTPVERSSGQLVCGYHVPTRQQRQQEGGKVMFWSGIMRRELVGLIKVLEGVSMTSEKFVDSLFLPSGQTLEPKL